MNPVGNVLTLKKSLCKKFLLLNTTTHQYWCNWKMEITQDNSNETIIDQATDVWIVTMDLLFDDMAY